MSTVRLSELPSEVRTAILQYETKAQEVTRLEGMLDRAQLAMCEAREEMINALLEAKT